MADSIDEPETTDLSLDEGMLLDYITGQPVKETPKEQVRQRIARAFLHEYAISVDDMAPDYRLKVDGKTGRSTSLSLRRAPRIRSNTCAAS